VVTALTLKGDIDHFEREEEKEKSKKKEKKKKTFTDHY